MVGLTTWSSSSMHTQHSLTFRWSIITKTQTLSSSKHLCWIPSKPKRRISMAIQHQALRSASLWPTWMTRSMWLQGSNRCNTRIKHCSYHMPLLGSGGLTTTWRPSSHRPLSMASWCRRCGPRLYPTHSWLSLHLRKRVAKSGVWNCSCRQRRCSTWLSHAAVCCVWLWEWRSLRCTARRNRKIGDRSSITSTSSDIKSI